MGMGVGKGGETGEIYTQERPASRGRVGRESGALAWWGEQEHKERDVVIQRGEGGRRDMAQSNLIAG